MESGRPNYCHLALVQLSSFASGFLHKKWHWVVPCLSWKNGKHTCFQTTPALPLSTKISIWGELTVNCSAEGEQLVLMERVSEASSPVFRRVRQHDLFNSCRAFSSGAGPQLFLARIFDRKRQLVGFLPVRPAGRGARGSQLAGGYWHWGWKISVPLICTWAATGGEECSETTSPY